MAASRSWAGAAVFALAVAIGVSLAIALVIVALSDAARAEVIVAKLAGVAIGVVASYLGGQALPGGAGDTDG